MKTSINVSVAILALAAWLGHAGEQHIRTARETHARLLADMARAGIPADTGPHAGKSPTTKRPRDKDPQDILALAMSLADFFRMPAEERASIANERLESMSTLSPDEFIELIAALRSEKCPEDGLDYVFYAFSRVHPRGILEFLGGSPHELPETGGGSQNVINGSVFMWSREDPEAALEWYRRNKDKSPLFSSPEARNFLLSGISLKSPATAFRILGELGLPAGSASQIMGAIRPESRLEGLAELRAFSKNRDPDGDDGLLRNGISSLARSISYQDFPDAEEWIRSAKLDPSELQAFVGGLEKNNFKDIRPWIEWIDRTLPEGEGDQKIREMFRLWVFNDYRTAGEWLDAQPEGTTRNAAIQAHAEITSQHNPPAAEKLAMMLPPGAQRDETLKSIYENWLEIDGADDASRAAAKAFAEQHGIGIGEQESGDESEDE